MKKKLIELIDKNADDLLRLTLIVEDLQKMILVMNETHRMALSAIDFIFQRIQNLERNEQDGD